MASADGVWPPALQIRFSSHDNGIVITGSFNFTKAAERNAKNVLIIRDRELAGKYAANWRQHAGHSR